MHSELQLNKLARYYFHDLYHDRRGGDKTATRILELCQMMKLKEGNQTGNPW